MEKSHGQKTRKFEQSEMGLDLLFMATTLFRHRRFEDCLEICNQLLTKNPKDQVTQTIWNLTGQNTPAVGSVLGVFLLKLISGIISMAKGSLYTKNIVRPTTCP